MKIALFDNPQSFDAPPEGNLAIIPNVYLIFLKTRSLTYILPLTVFVYLHSNFSLGRRKTFLISISARGTFQLFKVIQHQQYWCQSKAHVRLPISP